MSTLGGDEALRVKQLLSLICDEALWLMEPLALTELGVWWLLKTWLILILEVFCILAGKNSRRIQEEFDNLFAQFVHMVAKEETLVFI